MEQEQEYCYPSYKLYDSYFKNEFKEPHSKKSVFKFPGSYNSLRLLSIKAAARYIGISYAALHKKISKCNIEYFLVNDRPFIPDFIAEFEKTKKDKIPALEIIIAPKKRKDFGMVLWRAEDIRKCLLDYEHCETVRVSIDKSPWQKKDRVIEFYIKDGIIIESIPISNERRKIRGNERMVDAWGEHSTHFQEIPGLKIMPEEDWQEIKKDILTKNLSKINCEIWQKYRSEYDKKLDRGIKNIEKYKKISTVNHHAKGEK